LPLFLASGFTLVEMKLGFAQSAQGFPPAPRLTKIPLLLIAQLLHPHQFGLQFTFAPHERRFSGPFKLQFCSGGTSLEIVGSLFPIVLFVRIQLLDHVPHPRHLLIGGAQTQFLLVLEALIEVQYGLQRKAKGHDGSTWKFNSEALRAW
jgi:hypothetical protein